MSQWHMTEGVQTDFVLAVLCILTAYKPIMSHCDHLLYIGDKTYTLTNAAHIPANAKAAVLLILNERELYMPRPEFSGMPATYDIYQFNSNKVILIYIKKAK